MDEITTRERIFKGIRNALIEKSDNPFPDLDCDSSVYHAAKESLDVTFAQEFTKVAGKFVYCEDELDMAEKLKSILYENKEKKVYCFDDTLKYLLQSHQVVFEDKPGKTDSSSVGIGYCESLVARLGSILTSSRQFSGRRLQAFPEIHIVVANTAQLVYDLKDAFSLIREKYEQKLPSSMTVITGPSRTADIEKTLVMGAHGPKELYLLLVEQNC